MVDSINVILKEYVMKKIVIIIGSILMLCNTNIKAQINYENTYSLPNTHCNFRITNLGNNNYKYVVVNYHDHYFSLYNLDHTPLMLNISVPLLVDTGNGSYNIAYITSTLFDCDSNTIEYALFEINATPTTKFYIYRTDGSLFFSRDSVTMPYCSLCGAGGADVEGITNTATGAKMLLFNSNNQFFVYNLCGTLPETISEIQQGNHYVQVYPNPTTGEITFEIDAPSNMEDYQLYIYDATLQKVKSENCSGRKTLTIDNSILSSGNYFYSLQTKNKIVQTGKFIITK